MHFEGRLGRQLALIAAAVTLTAGRASAAELPPGADLADGLAVHVSPKGIDFLENQIQYLVPAQIPVGNQQGELFSCFLDTCDWRLRNTVVYLDVGKVSLTPQEGHLQLHLELYVSATGRIETNGCLFNNGCNVTLDPSLVTADTTIALALVPDGSGRYEVDATTEAFGIGLSLNDPELSGCFLDNFANFLIGLFMGTIEDAVDSAIEGQVAPLLEPAIEDAFNALNLVGQLDLNGVPIDYDFYPTGLEIHPGTIGIVMGGHFATEQVASCANPDVGSLLTVGDLPTYGALSPGGSEYSIAASLSDDLLNQLLFSAWRGGLLCLDIDDGLDSSVLELLGGGIKNIVTEGGALVISVRATEPPIATLGGPNGETAMISLANMEIDMLADVEGRMARIVGLKLSPLAGATLTFNAQGQLVPTLNFDATQVEAEVLYNELAPDINATILNLLPTLVEQFLPTLTEAIPPIDLPDLGGIVIESAEFTPDGPAGDYLSAYAGLGGQIQAGGCSAIPGGGSCGVPENSLSCAVGGSGNRSSGVASFAASPAMLMMGIGALLARRRRER